MLSHPRSSVVRSFAVAVLAATGGCAVSADETADMVDFTVGMQQRSGATGEGHCICGTSNGRTAIGCYAPRATQHYWASYCDQCSRGAEGAYCVLSGAE